MAPLSHLPAAFANTPPSLRGELLRDTVQTLSLKGTVGDDMQLATLIVNGLPAAAIEGLLKRGVDEDVIFRFVIPRRTYQRRLANRTLLTSEESDKTERVARLLALATLVFDDEHRAAQWLSAPKRRFDGKTPLAMIASSIGTKLVEESLLQAYYGLTA